MLTGIHDGKASSEANSAIRAIADERLHVSEHMICLQFPEQGYLSFELSVSELAKVEGCERRDKCWTCLLARKKKNSADWCTNPQHHGGNDDKRHMFKDKTWQYVEKARAKNRQMSINANGKGGGQSHKHQQHLSKSKLKRLLKRARNGQRKSSSDDRTQTNGTNDDRRTVQTNDGDTTDERPAKVIRVATGQTNTSNGGRARGAGGGRARGAGGGRARGAGGGRARGAGRK